MKGLQEYALLSAPYERTTSFLTGAALGPEEFLEDLESVLNEEDYPRPRTIVRLADGALRSPRSMVRALAGEAAALASRGVLPVMLGGEHTCTLGPATGLKELFPKMGMVHLDAHADQRNRYQGSRYSHASVMRRVVEDLRLPLLSVGVRAFCRQEMHYLRAKGVGFLPGHRIDEWRAVLPALLGKLPASLYLTLDMDFFDPSVAPGVGTPEPGGAGWYRALDMLDAILEKKKLVGFDIVELCPPRERKVTLRAAVRILLYILDGARAGVGNRV